VATVTEAQVERLASALASSRLIAPLLRRWPEIELPDAWLAAGAVSQTIWNLAHRQAPQANIKDIDLIYFDDGDLSAESENRHEVRIRRLFADLGVAFDVKNEARVHLWYREKFGGTIAPYRSIEDAVATFPTTATAIGVRPAASNRLDICAPFGLDDLLNLVVRANKRQITRSIYEAKIARWRQFWPNLEIVGWDDDDRPRSAEPIDRTSARR
jgi:uncharacterized protein